MTCFICYNDCGIGIEMKIDRLIGILSVLLQKETVTAPYLAEKFEVSRRTINRDVEELCRAGIPIVTKQGAGGGISIMNDYKLERTLLTGTEMQDILAGLRSLDSASGTNRYRRLMEKLSVGASDFMTGNQSVLIDLSSWDKRGLTPKIESVRTAIDTGRELEFRYYAPYGESDRCIQPYYLIFHWSSWYVWGWCKVREDYRLFKLNRMEALSLSDRTFEKKSVPLPDLSNEHVFPEKVYVKALFDAECKWRLIEEFGSGCFAEQEDGRLLFCRDYTDEEHLILWILGFQERAELLEPEHVRERLRQIIQKMEERYR